jgi:hypothetical protein
VLDSARCEVQTPQLAIFEWRDGVNGIETMCKNGDRTDGAKHSNDDRNDGLKRSAVTVSSKIVVFSDKHIYLRATCAVCCDFAPPNLRNAPVSRAS